MARCTSCNQEMADNARFCSQCGAAASPAPTAAGGHVGGSDNQATPAPGVPVPAASQTRDPSERIWTGWPSRKRHLPMLGISLLLTAGGLTAAGIGLLPAIVVPAIIVALLGLAGALWTIGRMLLEPLMLRYWLTADRLFIRRGLLRVRIDQTELIRVDDITVEQGIVDRLFGIGTVQIKAATDKSDSEIDLFGIDDPMRVCELIRTGSQALRRKGGMFIEHV